jgi:hypothetical protein
MGHSVQFAGIDTVIRAYNMREEEKFWAVFQSKSLLMRGEGEGDLISFLQLLEQNGSQAIYTLKVYDNVNDYRQIRERTEASGSFNFQLHKEGQGRSDYYMKIEERLKVLESGDSDEDEDTGVLGKIGSGLIGVLGDPDKLTSVINSLPAIIGSIKDLIRTPGGVQAIGNIAREYAGAVVNSNIREKSKENNTTQMSAEEKMQRIAAAIDKLERNDKNILQHLEKLAELSESNPQLFKMLTKNLDEL